MCLRARPPRGAAVKTIAPLRSDCRGRARSTQGLALRCVLPCGTPLLGAPASARCSPFPPSRRVIVPISVRILLLYSDRSCGPPERRCDLKKSPGQNSWPRAEAPGCPKHQKGGRREAGTAAHTRRSSPPPAPPPKASTVCRRRKAALLCLRRTALGEKNAETNSKGSGRRTVLPTSPSLGRGGGSQRARTPSLKRSRTLGNKDGRATRKITKVTC